MVMFPGDNIDITSGTHSYVRWRDRMCRLSLLADIKLTLETTGWFGQLTNYPLEVTEFFPEFQIYVEDATHINTLVVDVGEALPMAEWQMGGGDMGYSRLFRLSLGMYTESDEVGIGIFSDLGDRYNGLTASPFVSLFNYNSAGPDYPLVTRMEVAQWQHTRAPNDVSPYEHHLWYGELIVRDFINGDRVEMES